MLEQNTVPEFPDHLVSTVVQYDGTYATNDVPHDLGGKPKVMIVKRWDGSAWSMYHCGIGEGMYIRLNENSSKRSNTAIWKLRTY